LEYVRLGKSGLMVSRVAFGSMRLVNVSKEDDSAILIRKAYDSGINFFDTTRRIQDSEKILGDAIYDIKKNVILATTTTAFTGNDIRNELESSLMSLHCDSIDLYQYETDVFLPFPGFRDKIYDTLVALKNENKIKHIGIVTTNIDTAKKAVLSGLYETIQFPFSIVSSEAVIELVKMCDENDVGFIAMQPLCGGVVQNIPLAFGFLHQYENVIPLWGVQNKNELEQILYFNEHPPVVDEKFLQDVEKERMFFN
jgi:uncharacterized protein